MTATTRPRSGAIRAPRAAPVGSAIASDSGYNARRADSYAAGRLARRRRGRLVGFAVAVPLWALSVVPLARESLDGREGARLLLVYLAVGALSLGFAVAIRGVYVLLAKRRLWSPWVFPLAAVLAIAGHTVQTAGSEEVPIAGARAGAWREEPAPTTLTSRAPAHPRVAAMLRHPDDGRLRGAA